MITPLGDINRLLKQMHEPDEYHLAPYDLLHSLYWIWILQNSVINDLPTHLRKNIKEHARFDVFINGQFIGPKDYIVEQFGKDIIVKFKRSNFQYDLERTDSIKMSGDFNLTETTERINELSIPSALRYISNEDDTNMIQENGDRIFLI
jgi:hypothetical protein